MNKATKTLIAYIEEFDSEGEGIRRDIAQGKTPAEIAAEWRGNMEDVAEAAEGRGTEIWGELLRLAFSQIEWWVVVGHFAPRREKRAE